MTFATTSPTPQTQEKLQQNVPPLKRREEYGGRENFRKRKCPQHLLVYSIIPILAFLCWLPDFIVALKDVSVTIPQAVKRGSNAMLTCNYDMENDTLYSVKWYKGRREFYRYTPKENPAMKVFPSQSGLNVERNLSNQSHVVLLAVPLNISGKFTCEISVEAPSFQTAMVSGEMEVVELPEEQATVTGIQPRYRIGDLVDGNCSIKYSKPAANLTWTINGIVVPPHHIKTYQIEKYEESNLESVMSAIHFMVTTQHFIKGQMRLKCTAGIFDIFKEEIESVIEEDRPRIMASGQSYPPDHGYGTQTQGDGYEHNESYLTYFSAPKSSASPTADCLVAKIVRFLKQNLLKDFQPLRLLTETRTQISLTTTFVNPAKSSLVSSISSKVGTGYFYILPLVLIRCITAVFVVLFVVVFFQLSQQQLAAKNPLVKLTHDKQMIYNFIEILRQMIEKNTEYFLTKNFWHKIQNRTKREQPKASENCYRISNDDDCQTKCGQRQQYQPQKYCLLANQNVVNKNDTNVINTINKNKNSTTIAGTITSIDCQHHMSQTLALATWPPTFCSVIHIPQSSFSSSSPCRCSSTTTSTASASASSSLSLPNGKTNAHDSFPLDAVDASKSNNAKYMSKDQTLLMTFNATAATSIVAGAALATSKLLCKGQSIFAPVTGTSVRALVLESELLQTSVHSPLEMVETHTLPSPTFFRNNYLMAFIGELLLRHC